jgi:hypothetical protein
VVAGILEEDALRDPYGRFYRYILRAEDGKFGLYGRNASGQIDLDLSLERSSAVAGVRPRGRPRRPNRRSVLVVDSLQRGRDDRCSLSSLGPFCSCR